MASVSLRRSDLFPVGTVVKIYPATAKQAGGPPTAQQVASGTVDAAGLLAITSGSIGSYKSYVAYAKVGTEHRYAMLRSTLDAQTSGHTWKKVGTTWPATVTGRRTASGTS
jgi:hypothetical protein